MKKEIRMTKAHKQFILKKLIPFIQRDHGRGFDMDNWVNSAAEAYPVSQTKPACGTVCCIGGSIDVLLYAQRKRLRKITIDKLPRNLSFMMDSDKTGEAIGLDSTRSDDLFYSQWPEPYAERFDKANGNQKKEAEVACSLLRAVVRTSGKILD